MWVFAVMLFIKFTLFPGLVWYALCRMESPKVKRAPAYSDEELAELRLHDLPAGVFSPSEALRKD
ncbi:MAG: hypothetical protein JJT94_07425 [Bernardetiaceae bacterium]|nr:hypothetical protein [Bernardetiaceae bacterium]